MPLTASDPDSAVIVDSAPRVASVMSHVADPLSESERSRLREIVDARGETYVVTTLGLGRQTLARILAGLLVRRGTAALIRQWLRELDALEPRRAL